MKYYYMKQSGRKMGMRTWMLGAAFFALHSSLFTSTVMAQQKGMVTDIKVIAVQDFDELATQGAGYIGTGNKNLDFRKGRGGGYVFAVFKKGASKADTTNYITDVVVNAKRESLYGRDYNDGIKKFTRAPYYQAKRYEDKSYYGGLNGRNYSIYGGDYSKQDHVYICRTGNTDFSNRVLKDARVVTTEPKNLADNQTKSGPHAGGGRYFVFTWHTHVSKFNNTGDITTHEHYCDGDQCGLFKVEPHRFDTRYGNDIWGQYPADHKDCATLHYKKCLDCGKEVTENHSFATYVSNWTDHNKRCLVCGYVDKADHKNFGIQKLPIDEISHMIYCDDCKFMKKFDHDYTYNRVVKHQDCEQTLVELTCSQCYHHAVFEEAGLGHVFDANGLCTRDGCLHPYERPAVEPQGSDSVFVVSNFGQLYWVANYVNNRRPKTNIRLASDLVADSLVSLPWRPIGATDSTAFQGTFDGGGHVISMLQTEKPVAGCGYRGLFGMIGQGGTVKNVTIAACDMRGWDYIGAVAGVNEGKIDHCNVVFSFMTSIGSGMNLGGICGLNKGTISSCTAEKTVWVGSVRDYAGGICGTNAGGTLSGNVTAAICGSGSDAVLPEVASQQ